MSKIFYIGSDDKVYGPVTELDVQGWYASGYLSSDVKFQISVSDRFDANERLLSLSELIELNGRTLPFYFSPEKENREKKQEESFRHLQAEFESLRTLFNDNQCNARSEEKEMIDVLKSQVASLLESQSDLLQKLSTLSNKREPSPKNPQLEKKMVEIKKKVDEQDKSLAAIKKEIGTVSSKCDRNDTKLDKLLEKQKEMDGSVNHYGRQIAELRSSEKSIRSSISSCEQNAVSTSNQLQSTIDDIEEVKKEMEAQNNDSSACCSKIETLKKALSNVVDVVDQHEELLKSTVHAQNSNTSVQKDVENVPPWEKLDKKRTVDIESSKAERLPWENDGKSGSESTYAPEPWNQQNQKGVTKDSKDAREAGQGTSVDQKKKKIDVAPAKNEKVAVEAKPASRTKDWAAICRELSDEDDKEEREEQVDEVAAARAVENELAVKLANNFIRDFTVLLEFVCAALDKGDFDTVMPFLMTGPGAKMLSMNHYLTELCRQNHGYGLIREAVKKEIRRYSAIPIYCHDCKFLMSTPHVMLIHFLDETHIDRNSGNFAKQVGALKKFIAFVFSKSIIDSEEQIDELVNVPEDRLGEKGFELAMKEKEDMTRLRPDADFLAEMFYEMCEEIVLSVGIDGVPEFVRTNQESGQKRMVKKLKTWMQTGTNREKIESDFEKHLAEGIAACVPCVMAFESTDEYYQHMTSYGHVFSNQSLFTEFMLLWKGEEYWNVLV